jgi:hypothetical protein
MGQSLPAAVTSLVTRVFVFLGYRSKCCAAPIRALDTRRYCAECGRQLTPQSPI